MPIYEYRCRTCEKDFEELVRSAEAASSVRCPTCGGYKIDRMQPENTIDFSSNFRRYFWLNS